MARISSVINPDTFTPMVLAEWIHLAARLDIWVRSEAAMIGLSPLRLPLAGSQPREILVGNAASVMLIWEVARLHQIDFDVFRGFRASATKKAGFVRDSQGRPCARAVERLSDIIREGSRHAEMFVCYSNMYRDEVDENLPFDLEECFDYLTCVDVDPDSLAKGELDWPQVLALTVASLAGLHRAELAVSVASSALSVLGQPVEKQYCDLALQTEMMALEGIRRRARLEVGVRRVLENRWFAWRSSSCGLRAVCSTRHGVPCALWRICKE